MTDDHDEALMNRPTSSRDGIAVSAVRLFGTVAATLADDEPAELGGPKPRAVLVELAVQAGRVVAADTLIDVLWGEEPPPTARRSLQAHVAKLRAALGGSDGPLRSEGPGYVLEVDRAAVDALRIEDTIRAARTLVATDPATARRVIEADRNVAAAEPLADLRGEPVAERHVERLERLGREMKELHADLLLRSDDPAEAIVELERLAASEPDHEPHWERLMRAYYRSGRQRDALVAFQRARDHLAEALGVDPSPDLAQLEVEILQQSVESTHGGTSCPYKGLTSYQIDDGPNFHGRSSLVDELVDLVTKTPLSCVVGASGAGKSSVLRAGLAHRALRGDISSIHEAAVFTPGHQPMRALFRVPEGADLVIVDQFEEIFTLTPQSERRIEFVDELVDMAESGRARVVIAVRGDFYGHCASLPALLPILAHHQIVVGPMTKPELIEAIAMPAVAAGLEVAPDVVEQLVADTLDRVGALPLLSHALVETWRRREGHTLTLQGYRDAGELVGSIASSAEQLHSALNEDSQRQLERLFLRLVDPGHGTAHTRRTVERSELAGLGIDDELIDSLVTARLLTVEGERVEIAHEALIEAWPRLGAWIDGGRDDIRTQRHLAASASSWEERSRDDADLYRGTRLTSTLAWIDERNPALSVLEKEFLETSDANSRGELARQVRSNRRLRLLALVTSFAMVAAAIGGVLAVRGQRDADRRAAEIEAAQIVTAVRNDADLTHNDALRVAAALGRETPTLATDGLLLELLLRSPDLVDRFDEPMISVRSRTGAAAGLGMLLVTSETVAQAVFNTFTLGTQFIGASRGRDIAAVTDRNRHLFGVDGDTLEVVDLETGEAVSGAIELINRPSTVDIDPEMTFVAAGFDGDGAIPAHIDVYEVSSGDLVYRLDTDATEVDRVIIDIEAGRVLAVLDDETAAVWDRGELVLRTSANAFDGAEITSFVNDIWFGAFAIGRSNGDVEIWLDDSPWRRIGPIAGHADAVTSVEFSFESDQLVSSSRDGTVGLWDLLSGTRLIGPLDFDTNEALYSWFHLPTGNIVTMDALGMAGSGRRCPVVG